MQRLEVGAADHRLLDRLGLSGALEGLHVQHEGDLSFLLESPLKRYLRRFRQSLVHVTGPEGFRGIRERGAILPNDGSFRSTFPQSMNSYSRKRGAVALFDFARPSPRQFVEQFQNVACFFPCHHPATLILLLSREIVGPDLIDYSQAFDEVGPGVTKIPHFEIWHAGSIPFRAVESVILMRERPYLLKTFAPRDSRLLTIEDLMRLTWPTHEIPTDPKSLSPVEALVQEVEYQQRLGPRKKRRIRRVGAATEE
jgi:hypothetical protein